MQKLFLSLIIINGIFGTSFGAETSAEPTADSGTEPNFADSFVVPKVDYTFGGLLKKDTSNALKMPTYSGSIGEDSLGSGLTLNYSSMFVDKETSDLINCGGIKLELPSPQAVALAQSGMLASCTNVLEEDEVVYSEENCRLLKSCSQAKTGNEEVNFANYTIGNNMAVEDLAALLLGDKLPVMEKVEALRKYADKKFGAGFSNSCRPQFDLKSTTVEKCDSKMMEIGFNYLNDTCSAVEKSCYNVGPDFGKNTPENESSVVNFFNQRTDAKVTDSLAADNEILDGLSQIMSSKDSVDSKVKAAIFKLKQLSDEKKLDPIFGYDADDFAERDITKTSHYKFFKSLAAKKLTTAAFKTEIEKHRRDYAKNLLKNDCKDTVNYGALCERVTSASFGKHENYPNKFSAAQKFKRLDSKHTEFLKLVFPKTVKSDKDALMILNASRCVALGVVPNSTVPGYMDISNSISSINLGNSFGSNLGLRLGPDFWNSSSSPSGTTVVTQLKEELFSGNGLKLPSAGMEIKPKLNESQTEISEVQEKSLSDSFSENFKNVNPTTNTGSIGSSSYNSAYNTVSNTNYRVETPVEQPVEKKVSNPGPASNPLNDRLSELTKKLTATEDHLAKLQESKDEEASEKALQKKRDEDNKTIADLQNQIAELKKESVKAPEKTPVTIAETNLGGLSRSPALSGSVPSVEAKKEENDKGSSSTEGAAARSSGQSAQSVSSGAESSPIAKNSASGGSSTSSSGSSTGGKPLLVLSKSDGMTAEKITESINEKIIELGGQSFEIEENGVKMEIIPEIKNGKILLDAKGKPRFLKKVKSGKELASAKSRVPASVTDQADLKRLEEEKVKRDRAMLRDLKNVTNKAVQKD